MGAPQAIPRPHPGLKKLKKLKKCQGLLNQLLARNGRRRLGTEVQESVARRFQRRIGPGYTLEAIARMTGVVQVVEVVGQAGELRKRLGPEVIQLEVLPARREDFVQKAIGATLLEVLSDERTVLGVVLDRVWGYSATTEDRQSSPRQRSSTQLRQGGFQLSLNGLVELRLSLVRARLQTLQFRLSDSNRRASILRRASARDEPSMLRMDRVVMKDVLPGTMVWRPEKNIVPRMREPLQRFEKTFRLFGEPSVFLGSLRPFWETPLPNWTRLRLFGETPRLFGERGPLFRETPRLFRERGPLFGETPLPDRPRPGGD
jgi:hypothetical protein